MKARAAEAGTGSMRLQRRPQTEHVKKAYRSPCRTSLLGIRWLETVNLEGELTFGAFLPDPTLQNEVESLTAHLAGEHEEHLDFS